MNPLREGEEYDVKIYSQGSKGDGLCKINGVIVFVPDTVMNKAYKIRITNVREKVAFGEVI